MIFPFCGEILECKPRLIDLSSVFVDSGRNVCVVGKLYFFVKHQGVAIKVA